MRMTPEIRTKDEDEADNETERLIILDMEDLRFD